MSFLNSNSVYVTPIAKDRTSHNRGKLLNEHTITTLVRYLVDGNGFVIDCESDDSGNTRVRFMLLGYFFDALIPTESDDNIKQPKDIYASIVLENNEIKGQDEGGLYTGLNISTTKPSEDSYLHILSYSDTENKWYVPISSYARFDLNRARVSRIDGKRSVTE